MSTAPEINPLLDVVGEAIAAVGDALPAQCATMSADGMTGAVAFVSSLDAHAEPTTADGPNEVRRLVANVADFPELSAYSLVEISTPGPDVDTSHIVTSLSKTGEAAWFVGLSAAMEECRAAVSGVRRRGSDVRALSLSAAILLAEGPRLDTAADAVGPNLAHAWYLAVRDDEWFDETPPQIGDAFKVFSRREGREVEIRISAVASHRGYRLLTGRGL